MRVSGNFCATHNVKERTAAGTRNSCGNPLMIPCAVPIASVITPGVLMVTRVKLAHGLRRGSEDSVAFRTK